jgi:hypothetical protein
MLTMVLLSPTGDGAAKAMLVVERCKCRVMLVTMLLSHDTDGTAKVTLRIM